MASLQQWRTWKGPNRRPTWKRNGELDSVTLSSSNIGTIFSLNY